MKGRGRNGARTARKRRPAGKGKEKPASSRSLPGPAPTTLAVSPSFQPLVSAFARERAVTVEKGWGSGNIVLKVRGKIFAMQMGADFVLKLPRTRVDELVDSSTGARFDPRRDGRVMKEWLVLHPGAARWVDLVGEAHRFVRGAVK